MKTLLWPRPQVLERSGPPHRLPATPLIRLGEPASELLSAAERLRAALAEGGLHAEIGAGQPPPWDLRLDLEPGAPRGPESYRLEIGETGVHIIGADRAGLDHGVSTLRQLLAQHKELPGLRIEDWPLLAERGVMLDVSRDKVPRLETLLSLVDRLASWKVNQLQLYLEHAFAYRGHETVWEKASPLTTDDLLRLDRHCNERNIELVANQNSFGHFHRWLVHDAYRPLAECPEGLEHPFSPRREPFSLCPTDPEVPRLLAGLYDQLLPNFRSRRLNVGLDETFDLGRGRSAAACESRGVGQVYLDFVHEVHRLAAERGHTIQLWADILLHHPELLAEVPHDAQALVWGYEAEHPFAAECSAVAASGLEFLVCPGTSSWISFGGRLRNALANQLEAVRAAHENGARGCLVTEWGDQGHLQPLPISEAGLFLGAGLAWNPDPAPEFEELPELLDRLLFEDSAGILGSVAAELGEVHLESGARTKNGTVLFRLLVDRRDPADFEGLTREGLERVGLRLRRCRERLRAAASKRPDGELIRKELVWVSDILELSAQLGRLRLEYPGAGLSALPTAERSRLAEELDNTVEERRRLWSERNRPGGREDAMARLLAARYELVSS